MTTTRPVLDAILSALKGATVAATRVVVRAWAAWQHRRAVANLLMYDDRMLGDIGLTRGDVVASLSGSPFEDASHRLDELARERREGRTAQRREAVREARAFAPVDGGDRVEAEPPRLARIAA